MNQNPWSLFTSPCYLKRIFAMKNVLLVLTVLSGLLFSCPQDSPSSNNDPVKPVKPVDPVKPDQRTLVVFDNTYGVCTALVYNDYRRRSGDKIVEVPAGQRSREMEWDPGDSEPFYFAYAMNLNGVSDFTLSYVPEPGKNQKSVRIDANTKTIVLIPKLDETLSSADQLLSSDTSLLLKNNSLYSLELHRGAASIPANNTGLPVVNSREKAFYTINTSNIFDPGSWRVANYHLLVGTAEVAFPGSPERFETGHFYSYTYNGVIALDTEIPIKIDNIIVKTYTVSFDTNGASGTAPAAQTIKAGSYITLPAGNGLSKSGHTFGGWNLAASGAETNYSAGASYLATGDITLYVRWYPLGTVTYTITFDSNGGNAAASQNMASGSAAFRPANPVRTGYTFVDWYSDSGLTSVYDFSKPVTGNITLYAKWNVIRYTVMFNVNGASGTAPASQTVNAGSVITMPNGNGLSKIGYTFGGWSTDDSGMGTGYSAGASYTVGGDITLFAKWDAIPCIVTFVMNGGSAVPSQTLNYGATAARPENPVKDGYMFVNWYSDPGLTAVYDFSSPVTGNTTLYAGFTEGVWLAFNKQYGNSIGSGGSHYYWFIVASGVNYRFISTAPAAVRYGNDGAHWFILTSGTVYQTAGQSGEAYIKIDGPAAYSLSVRHPEPGVTAFSINGYSGIISETEKTIAVTVPHTANLGSLTPIVTAASGWACATAGAKDFNTPVEYVFTKDAVSQIYTVTVTYSPGIDGDISVIEQNGNGDGKINPGETAQLGITVKNFGTTAASNLQTSLGSFNSSYITVSNNNQNIGMLSGGSTAAVNFTLVISSGCPIGPIGPLTLTLTENDGQNRTWTDTVPAFDIAVPVPANVKAEALSETSVRVSWDSVTGATSYKVYNSGGALLSTVNSGSTLQYEHIGRNAGTVYSYKVSALIGSDEGPQSATVSARTWAGLEFGRQYSGTVEPGIPHYYRFNIVNSVTYAFISDVNAEVRYENGDASWFSLSAGTASRASEQNGWAYIKIENTGVYAVKVDMPVPTNIQAAALSDTVVRVSWNQVTGASGYKVYDSGGILLSTINNGSTPQYEHTGCSAGTVYSYTVSALIGSDEGVQSSAVSVKTWERLVFNRQYSGIVNSGVHYYQFYVNSGVNYTFTSTAAFTIKWEDGVDWFSSSGGTENRMAGQTGGASIILANQGDYSIKIVHGESAVNGFAFSSLVSANSVVNETDKTITVNNVPLGTNLAGLTPTVTVAEGWLCETTGAKNFNNSVEYVFTKGEAGQVYTVTVVRNGEGGLVINPPSANDESIAGFPAANFSVSRTGSPAWQTIILTGTGYSSVQWWVDQSNQSAQATNNGMTFAVQASAYTIGKHTLMVVVYKNGIPYSNAVDFTVTH